MVKYVVSAVDVDGVESPAKSDTEVVTVTNAVEGAAFTLIVAEVRG